MHNLSAVGARGFTVRAVDVRIQRLRTIYERLTAELPVDEDVAAQYSAADHPSAVAG